MLRGRLPHIVPHRCRKAHHIDAHHRARESVVARDVTIPSSQWGNRLLEFYRRESNIFPVGGGIDAFHRAAAEIGGDPEVGAKARHY